MKSLLLFLGLIVSSICASAQKVYFIYLQSDNGSAFYVKMNDKIFSSTTSGYLILSNLVDSTYNFSLGFPSSSSESKFVVKLGAKDRGFVIKKLDAGLGLFDLQNLNIISEQKDNSSNNTSYTRRTDDFSYLLSKAAKDTSLLYAVTRVSEESTVMQKEEPKIIDPALRTEESILSKDTNTSVQQVAIVSETKKQDTILPLQPNIETKTTEGVVFAKPTEELKIDTIASIVLTEQTQQNSTGEKTNLNVDTLAKTDLSITSVNNEAVFKKSQVKKYSESSTTEGFGLVYYDIYDGGRDTIRLLIPNPPIIFKTAEQDSSLSQKNFIRIEELKKDTVQQIPIVVSIKNNVSVQSQCKAIASSNDFFKLRKNMASENTDDGMVDEAKKVFKSKCFATDQIKNLSALFLTSAGKYQFFDAAYLHVSDQENFSSLESEIKDEYYLKRFKALIGE
jgi:hypothetical protein